MCGRQATHGPKKNRIVMHNQRAVFWVGESGAGLAHAYELNTSCTHEGRCISRLLGASTCTSSTAKGRGQLGMEGIRRWLPWVRCQL